MIATLRVSGRPTVSVIIPARNEEASLSDCLNSLIAQKGVACEILVIDDHSTDRTLELASSFPTGKSESLKLPSFHSVGRARTTQSLLEPKPLAASGSFSPTPTPS